MTCLRTTCPDCGRLLEAHPSALLLDRATKKAWLICDVCADLVARPVTGALATTVFTSLVFHGGHVVDSAAARYPERRPAGAPLSADDVLALHQGLSDDDAVAGAVRALTTEQPA